jgi:hypothetical protein
MNQWNSIKQGSVGTCGLLSAIITLLNAEAKRNQLLISDKIYPRD